MKVVCEKWEDVCKYKRNCGLWVKDASLLNLAILGNWRWKMLEDMYFKG